MLAPRALILRAPGTNCDHETAHAFERAGAIARRLHVNALAEKPALADDFQILCIPGGFSYGDDIASGRVLAVKLRERLWPALRAAAVLVVLEPHRVGATRDELDLAAQRDRTAAPTFQ